MFTRAIQKVSAFTRPIHFISRYYGSAEVRPGAATMFFINADGFALTCRHVSDQLFLSRTLPAAYATFKAAVAAPRGKLTAPRHLREVEKRFRFTHDTLIELQFHFMNCVDTLTDIKITPHPTLDLALIQFQGFTKLDCNTFPLFPKDPAAGPRQGQFVCRLGFPFPEFSNFSYDATTDAIVWNSTGRIDTPQFPIEGMVTRQVMDAAGQVVGFEVSTPGLRGQSGGPAFTVDGVVLGMQSTTFHVDLDFDVDLIVPRGGHMRPVRESAVMHVGRCVHVEAIKAFLRSHNVTFDEA
ncbi:MAG: trypsin-like peptidase domain-containing protein [Thermoanaerobaculia bacterium]